jgi:hypothetical protein
VYNENPEESKFQEAMSQAGTDFSGAFIQNLYRLITTMKPRKDQAGSSHDRGEGGESKSQFPGLALPNDDEWVPLIIALRVLNTSSLVSVIV